MRASLEPVQCLRVTRAGSCLRAGQGRTRKWTSVHDRVMTQGCGQTDPARRVALAWPPSGGARLDPCLRRGRLCQPGRRCATHHHLTAMRGQRELRGDIEQALSIAGARTRPTAAWNSSRSGALYARPGAAAYVPEGVPLSKGRGIAVTYFGGAGGESSSISEQQPIRDFVCLQAAPVHLEALKHGTAQRNEDFPLEQPIRDAHVADFAARILAAVDTQGDIGTARFARRDGLEESFQRKTLRTVQDGLTVHVWRIAIDEIARTRRLHCILEIRVD